ncbi:uncharacterized protein VTP21DRAFT_3630 [Calcarisporiella thermophila]|uniref:uncharacterized protein n=1 Tax=Calcarisporiella thermophila TaxID=911321 RepID=UPI003742FFB5
MSSFTFGQSSTPFGQQSTGTGFGGFGQTSTATPSFAFGAAASQPQQPQQSTSGFSFGSTPAPSLFGGASSTSTAPSSLLTPAPTGGLFGNQSQQQQQQQKPGGFTFGTTPASTATTGFGATSTAGGTGFGFGQTPATSTGINFGAKPATTGAGQTGLFGNTLSAPSLGSSLLGSTQTQPQQQTSLIVTQQPPQPSVWDMIEYIKSSWDPASPNCQFRHYFYNLVHPSEVHLYGRSPGEDEMLWQQAQQNNPNPSCMVPTLAVGFEAVKKRIELQEKQTLVHQMKLKEIAEKLDKLRQKHHLDTSVKLEEQKRKHMDLAHRVLQLIKKVQILRNKGHSIRPDEEALRVRLENLQLQLRKPPQFRGRVNELWAQLQMLKESRRLTNGVENVYGGVDEEQLENMTKVLSELQTGLSDLMEKLEKDMRDEEIIRRGIEDRIE